MSESPQSTLPGSPRSSLGPWIIVGLVVLLLILHQDNWLWLDDRLILGFIPIGLFWHACISIGASVTWFLATKIAWPLDTPPLDTTTIDEIAKSEVSE